MSPSASTSHTARASTVTCCAQVAEFPLASVAVQVTVVVPTRKLSGASFVTVGLASTTSATVGIPRSMGCPWMIVRSGGQTKVGAVVSSTVTLKLPVTVLLAASVAVQVTVVVPRAKVLSEAGSQSGVIPLLTKSVAETLKITVAPLGSVASVMRLSGTVRVGGVVSTTVTVKLPVAVLPA